MRPIKKWYAAELCVLSVLREVVVFFLGGDVCVRCGKASGVLPLCATCLDVFVRQRAAVRSDGVPRARCGICGKVLVSEIDVCATCRSQPVLKATDRTIPLQVYRLWNKSVLFAWKSERKRTLSPVFAQLFFSQYEALCAELGMRPPVVPVPARPGKIKAQGWDQVDELCTLLRKGWGVVIKKPLVRRSRAPQKKKNRALRLAGTMDSYALASVRKLRRILPSVPHTVVLADDVMTTGATLETCASLLKKIGVTRVFAITLFVVD